MTQSFSIPGAGQRAILAVLVAASLVSCNQGDQLPGAPSGPAHSSAATGIGIVSDLRVTATTDSSVTLTFTEVTDGTGLPAGYDVRFATAPLSWGSAAEATRGSCASPLAGIRIGAARSCTVLGLAAATTYQFQVVGFRGILDLSAVFGDLSNVAAGTTPGTTGGGAGGTVLLQEGFEDGSLASRGWYDNTALAVTAAQHHDGSSALEAHFLAGATTPTWGGAARHLFTPSNSVYLSYWVKYSSNWVGSGATYHPHEFLFLTTEDGAYVGPSSTHLTTYVEHNYQNGGIPVLDMQDGSNIDQSKIGVDLTRTTENRAANGCNGTLDGMGSCYLGPAGIYQNEKRMEASAPTFLPNPGTGYKGDWHFVEAYFQLNSIQSGKGVADGIAQYWFDGQLVINQTHLLMRTGVHATMQFNQFMIAPYIGDGSPVDQTMWVDDVTLATARVGSAPPPPTVATVTVTPTSATAVAGTTYQFGATPADASGNPLTGEAVTWSSSNTAVATVSTSGQATAVAAGSATIRATSNGVTGTAALTVTAAAPAPVATVTLSPATLSQAPGATAQLTATLKDAQGNLLTGRSVSWSSTKSAVATVSPSGLESAVAAGSATIKATSEGKSATATVTVTNTTAKPGTVANLTVAGSTDTSLTLSFTQVSDGTGKPASYDVRVGTAASFSWGGASSVTQGSCATPLAGTAVGAKLTCTVTGLTSGTAYDVQLVAYRGTLGGATFGGLSNVGSGTTTTPTASVGSVTVTPGSASGSVGQAAQFTATVRDLNGNVLSGRTVTWSSTNSAVVTVTATGYATAVGAGTAQLVATTGGKTGSAAITVTR